MEPLLTLSRVGFRYERTWALRGIDLEITAGEILGVLGPNGSGKSTLLRVMDGILVPEEGSLRLVDRPFAHLKRSEIARRVAMVPQETHFRFSFSSLEVVLMGRFPHMGRMQFEDAGDLEIAHGALEATDTLGLAERSIHDLSGGEKQRVLIARALAQEPQIVLLDEPTSFLDLKYKREVFQLVSRLSRERDLSVVVVSHDIDLAAQYCRRLILLKDGAVYTAGPPAEVVTSANVEAVYDCPVVVDRNPATGSPRVSIGG
jgi:iron complex transport system ATP-binding protein